MSVPPPIADVVPGIRGQGMLFADPVDYADIALALLTAGYGVCELDGADIVARRQALPALARVLRLPGAADRNLDALLDTLRDLPDRWPGATGIALLWRCAEQLVEGDPAVWEEIVEIVREASEELREDDFAFEAVAFLAGYDIPPLLLGVPHDQGPVL